MRAAWRVERPPEGGFGTRQSFDGPAERKFPAFRALEVELIAGADFRRQRGGGVSPESGLKMAVSHACNGGAAGVLIQTINSHPRDKKNS